MYETAHPAPTPAGCGAAIDYRLDTFPVKRCARSAADHGILPLRRQLHLVDDFGDTRYTGGDPR